MEGLIDVKGWRNIPLYKTGKGGQHLHEIVGVVGLKNIHQ
jgi:hypothetical protein